MLHFAISVVVAGKSRRRITDLAFRLDIPKGEIPDFVSGMHAIDPMSAESLLQVLCTVNHLLNDGEKLELSDIAIHDKEQESLKSGVEKRRTERFCGESEQPGETPMDTVRRGDTAAFKLRQVPPAGAVIAS